MVTAPRGNLGCPIHRLDLRLYVVVETGFLVMDSKGKHCRLPVRRKAWNHRFFRHNPTVSCKRDHRSQRFLQVQVRL